MRVQFRASQLPKQIGFSATLAVLQTRLPRPFKPQRAPTSCRSHQGSPPAPGPRCSVPTEDALSLAYLLLVQPDPDKHRGPTVCAWIRTCFVPGSAHRGGDGGQPRSKFLSLQASRHVLGQEAPFCSRDIPARPPWLRVNAYRSWVKPETGFPGLKICTIYPRANATEKRGLKVFNQFSGCCVLSFAASGDKSAEVSWAVPAFPPYFQGEQLGLTPQAAPALRIHGGATRTWTKRTRMRMRKTSTKPDARSAPKPTPAASDCLELKAAT